MNYNKLFLCFTQIWWSMQSFHFGVESFHCVWIKWWKNVHSLLDCIWCSNINCHCHCYHSIFGLEYQFEIHWLQSAVFDPIVCIAVNVHLGKQLASTTISLLYAWLDAFDLAFRCFHGTCLKILRIGCLTVQLLSWHRNCEEQSINFNVMCYKTQTPIGTKPIFMLRHHQFSFSTVHFYNQSSVVKIA